MRGVLTAARDAVPETKKEKKTKSENTMKTVKPYCIWICGMPNAGKSTLAYHLLQKKLRNCFTIDGDRFRERVNPELSFSRKDIIENNMTAIKVIKYMMSQGFNVLVAMITPFQEVRDTARSQIDNYIEVYVHCPEPVRRQRPNFMRSRIKFEEPKRPDVVVHTHLQTIDESVDAVLDVLQKKRSGHLHHDATHKNHPKA